MGDIPPTTTCAMLTDFYQITISLAQWKQGRAMEPAVFDLFYRVQPFNGSFAFFAGLEEAMNFIKNFKFTDDQLEYIRQNLPGVDPKFIEFLKNLDTKDLKIYAPKEGTVVFPREPLLRVEGPMALCQLIETPLLNAINFATLMTTNAARFRKLTEGRLLMEFGLRRAQGPDGAMAASKYSYMGGFDSTSNVLAGYKWGIPVAGTVAHSFVTSYISDEQLKSFVIKNSETGEPIDLLKAAEKVISDYNWKTNRSELISFIAQAESFPTNFLALVDTYDTLGSGVPNFLAVSYGLHLAGFRGKGIRLDSGDLADLSKKTKAMYEDFAKKYNIPYAANFGITASNDINEQYLLEMEREGHAITAYGIGTHLVTCQAQPALGGVYKLVEINGLPRIKLSNDTIKSTLPGRKTTFRLYKDGHEVCDVLALDGETVAPGTIEVFEAWPGVGHRTVEADRVEPILCEAFANGEAHVESVKEARERVLGALRGGFREDVIAIENPVKYSVCITTGLHALLERLRDEAI